MTSADGSMQYRGTIPCLGTVINPDGPDYFGGKDFAYLKDTGDGAAEARPRGTEGGQR